MKSCPKCKFLLTDHDASCPYCGQLLRGLDAGDTWSPVDGGVLVETDAGDSVARPAAVVRRAGGDIRTSAVAETHRQPVAPDNFYERSDVTRQHYSIQGQDEPRDSRRAVMLVGSVVLVVVIAVTLFVRSRAEDPPSTMTAQRFSWERVGPPAVPFTAELPGIATMSPLRPFDELTTHSYESSPTSGQSYLVGAFDLPEGALAFGPDAFMKATAEKIAALRGSTYLAGAGSDSTNGRTFDATLTSAGGSGWIHLAIHGPRLYYVAAFVLAGADDARQTYDRVVQSLVPA